MAVGHIDTTVYKSTDFSLDLDFTDSNGDELDLSSYTIEAKLRTTPSELTATSFDTSSSNLESGRVNLALTDTVTAGLSTGRYYWDVLGTQGTTTEKLMTGRITVLEAISR